MLVSYNGLWKLLIDKNMKKIDLVNELGMIRGFRFIMLQL